MDRQEFIESLYDDSEEYLNEIYKSQEDNKNQILDKLAKILLIYTIADNVLNLTNKEKKNNYSKLSTFLLDTFSKRSKNTSNVVGKILTKVADNSFNYYGMKSHKNDVENIINSNFKGRHFSDRIWENENQVCKKLHKEIKNFLDGKINVNQIKSHIEKEFAAEKYNVNRLVDTEIARCQAKAFDRFCKEVGVKKVIYRATLCNSCSDCLSDDGRVFDFKDKPELPRHPMCQCYYDIFE